MKLIPLKTKHIADGIANDCDRCPVALALLDATFTRAHVGTDNSDLRESSLDRRLVEHSDEVRWWIDDYDNDDEVVPAPVPRPVTLVLEDNRLLTLSEWQEEHRP